MKGRWQRPLAHCASSVHASPAGNVPWRSGLQTSSGLRTEPTLGRFAQAASFHSARAFGAGLARGHAASELEHVAIVRALLGVHRDRAARLVLDLGVGVAIARVEHRGVRRELIAIVVDGRRGDGARRLDRRSGRRGRGRRVDGTRGRAEKEERAEDEAKAKVHAGAEEQAAGGACGCRSRRPGGPTVTSASRPRSSVATSRSGRSYGQRFDCR